MPKISAKEQVRAELARMQKQTGLSLVSFHYGSGKAGILETVAFSSRSWSNTWPFLDEGKVDEGAISPDGSQIAFQFTRETGERYRSPWGSDIPLYRTNLAVIRQDGSGFQEYQDFRDPYGICWLPEKTTLVLSAKNLKQGKDGPRSLQVANLGSGATQQIDVRGDVTAQCSSPDGQQIVYADDQTIRVYDIRGSRSWELAKGRYPTWSPDGNWIAFLGDAGYFAIRPSGNEKKLLFKIKDALTPLWWSPDSRFVAYVRRDRLFEGSWVPEEQGRLRIRRLEDNAEDWLANLYVTAHTPIFQWVKILTHPD